MGSECFVCRNEFDALVVTGVVVVSGVCVCVRCRIHLVKFVRFEIALAGLVKCRIALWISLCAFLSLLWYFFTLLGRSVLVLFVISNCCFDFASFL